MFPFCVEDYDVVGICCHIDEEHMVEVKNGELGRQVPLMDKTDDKEETLFSMTLDLVVESPPPPPLTTANSHQLLAPPAPTANFASANHLVPPLFRI
ncbi:hypothetical protein RHMOL_Rhmol02G0175700 [Rhododendron molle]|uniref:Uncharacterized protein n=2 Tax=Rhododendron molle TaxID=49168 RepID=A0ACC0PT17_RHOML|nr:hypothetical protein RHMOL_Rhmol02G0175700 [Rhododendron molle]KAI8568158.1 hypothetical protein RHMOL_Rhmol02G0175700 [Rhododendron molle]